MPCFLNLLAQVCLQSECWNSAMFKALQAAVPDKGEAFVLDFVLRHKEVKAALDKHSKSKEASDKDQPAKPAVKERLQTKSSSSASLLKSVMADLSARKVPETARDPALKNKGQAFKQEKVQEIQANLSPAGERQPNGLKEGPNDCPAEAKRLPRVSITTNIGGGTTSLGPSLLGDSQYLRDWDNVGFHKQHSQQFSRSQATLLHLKKDSGKSRINVSSPDDEGQHRRLSSRWGPELETSAIGSPASNLRPAFADTTASSLPFPAEAAPHVKDSEPAPRKVVEAFSPMAGPSPFDTGNLKGTLPAIESRESFSLQLGPSNSSADATQIFGQAEAEAHITAIQGWSQDSPCKTRSMSEPRTLFYSNRTSLRSPIWSWKLLQERNVQDCFLGMISDRANFKKCFNLISGQLVFSFNSIEPELASHQCLHA